MGCSKIVYATRGEADKAARVTMATLRRKQKRRKKSDHLSPYRCPLCGLYHLTSMDIDNDTYRNNRQKSKVYKRDKNPIRAHFDREDTFGIEG